MNRKQHWEAKYNDYNYDVNDFDDDDVAVIDDNDDDVMMMIMFMMMIIIIIINTTIIIIITIMSMMIWAIRTILELIAITTNTGVENRIANKQTCDKGTAIEEREVCLLVACLTSQQQASVSQGRICTDNFTCCHTEIEVADQTFYLTQSQYTDTGPTSPSADPITPGAWQGSHWSANFEVTGMTRPRKNPGASGIRTRDLPLSRRTP